jgi:Protein of unknown function (DUF3467)
MAKKPSGSIQQLSEQEVRQKIKQSPDFKFIYANHSRVASSFYDLRVFLGQSNITPTGQITIEEDICIIMSPEGAKGFAENLLKTLLQYEQTFGKTREMVAQPETEKPRKN